MTILQQVQKDSVKNNTTVFDYYVAAQVLENIKTRIKEKDRGRCVTEVTNFILSVFKKIPDESKGFNKFKIVALEILDDWKPIDKSRSRSQGVEFLENIKQMERKLGRVPKCWEKIIENITEVDTTKVSLNQYIRALKVTGFTNLSPEAN